MRLFVWAAVLGASLGWRGGALGADFERVMVEGLWNVASLSSTPAGWADFDNDGDLDLLMTGSVHTALWQNDAGVFSRVTLPGMPSVGEGSVAWGDYDNDGRMDILITGLTIVGASTPHTAQLWRNTGTGFVRVPVAGLPGVAEGSAAWVDFNRDGLLDFTITGTRSFLSGPTVSQLWRNTGTGFSQVVVAGLAQVKHGSFAWCDYDRDGFPDFIITGSTVGQFDAAANPVTQLWHNTGTGFEEVFVPGLEAAGRTADWADYDQDGRTDFVIAGFKVAELWRNIGEDGFERVSEWNMAPVFGPLIFGDYNHDGRDDLFVTGGTDLEVYTRLMRNTGTGFELDPVAGLKDLGVAAAAWGDFDADGRLDFFHMGFDGNSEQLHHSEIWRNVSGGSNSVPTAPTGLSATIGTEVELEWSAATDGTNAAANLTYNLRVGSAPGLSDIVSPHAGAVSGYRRVAARGNAGYMTRARLRLPTGQYYWSVQAVDAGFAGGPFASESSFATVPLLSVTRNGPEAVLSWSPNLPGFILEETADLNEQWSPSDRGSEPPITISDPGEHRFFRLRQL